MKNKKNRILLLVIAALAVVVVILLVILLMPHAPEKGSEGTGVAGVISDGWDTGISSGGTESKGIQIPGYRDARMKEGDKTLRLSIGNPKDNEAAFYATVELEDGTVLYRSELLEPGFGMKEIPVSEDLKKGEYSAYVIYQIVSLDEAHTPMNTARSAFTLYVE